MKPDTLSFYETAVLGAVERVLADLDQALDLAALARSAALSPLHFHRIFKGMLGETPLELHRRLRMERAARDLRDTDTPVTTIAFAAGYETHESFTRAFRAHYSCSPSEFRQSRDREVMTSGRPFQIELAARSGLHVQADGSLTPIARFERGEAVMNVEIRDMPALRVATVRHVGPYNRISEAFARLGEIARRTHLVGAGTQMLAIYHDDVEATPEPGLRSDAALTIPESAALPEGLGEQHLPGGRYATTTHVGPYERLGDTWARLMGEWLPRSGQRLADGVTYEIYRNTPGDVPKDQLVTELYVPLV